MITRFTFIEFVQRYSERLTELQGTLNALDNRIGDGEVGDKTMIDVWAPVCEILQNDISDDGLRTAVRVARDTAQATQSLAAKRGRAAYLGDPCLFKTTA